MPPTRLFKATVFMLLAVMSALATVGHAFHDASCSEACELAANSRELNQSAADLDSGCSSCHSHDTDPVEENSPDDETPPHDSDHCGVCVFLSLTSPTVVLIEAPLVEESTESTMVQSDLLVALATRQSKTARGPPVRLV